MSEDKETDTKASTDGDEAASESAQEQPDQSSTADGPKFTTAPDPLAGVKKGASDVMASMEGKTVSMKTYVGTIIAVIVLMMLARCGD